MCESVYLSPSTMNVGTYKNNEAYAGDEMELETKVNISKLNVRTVGPLCCVLLVYYTSFRATLRMHLLRMNRSPLPGLT